MPSLPLDSVGDSNARVPVDPAAAGRAFQASGGFSCLGATIPASARYNTGTPLWQTRGPDSLTSKFSTSCGQPRNGRTTALLGIEAAITMNPTNMTAKMNVRLQTLAALVLVFLFSRLPASAADLKPETVQAWQEYIKAAEARNQQRLVEGSPFLAIDAAPAEAAKLRQGEILASPAAPNVPLKVRGGLIHDWTGAIFIPYASIREVLRVTRDYARYDTVFSPNVVNARPLEISEWEDRFSMVVMNKSFFAKSALDGDYHSTFTRLDDQHWYSVTETTRVQEVSDFGSASQYTRPEGHGIGIIWRLYSIARYEARDGGVYIELEAMALSRDIPAALRWVVEPMVRKVSRSSLVTSLEQTAAAVRANTNFISVAPSMNTNVVRSFR
jgi:hypothetical protein